MKKSQSKQSKGKGTKNKGAGVAKLAGIQRSNGNLGGLVAERDDSLTTLYVDNTYLEAALDHADPRCFLIGRTGSGKSAILRMVSETQDAANVLKLTTTDFTFKEVELNEAIVYLNGIGGNLSYLFKTIWKYLLVVSLVRRRYPDLRERKTLFQRIMMSVTDSKKSQAYRFLLDNEQLYGDKSFAERLSGMLEKLEGSIRASLSAQGIQFGVGMPAISSATLEFEAAGKTAGGSEAVARPTVRRELGREIAAIVERTWNVPSLQQVVDLLRADMLEGQKYWVLIDDLDKAFAESPLSSKFIQCLFEVIMEMASIQHIRFLVALRTNIFGRLDFYQREKVNDYCIFLSWSGTELQAILEQRVRWAFGNEDLAVFGKDALFAQSVRDGKRQVRCFEYLRSRTLDRPRDLISFAQEAIQASVGASSVTAETVMQAERHYSQGRLGALEDEWKEEHPHLATLLGSFRGRGKTMNYRELTDAISDALLLCLDDYERGCAKGIGLYVERLGLSMENVSPECEGVFELAKVFWRVGALGTRSPTGGDWLFSYTHKSEPIFSREFLRSNTFCVHPMLWAALEVRLGGNEEKNWEHA